MATPRQLTEAGKRNYGGSALQIRNKAMALAKRVAPVRLGDEGTDALAKLERVMTVVDLLTQNEKYKTQIDNFNREPFFLVRDEFNPGEFLPVTIYDYARSPEAKTGLCNAEIHAGSVLVKPDTLVYWK